MMPTSTAYSTVVAPRLRVVAPRLRVVAPRLRAFVRRERAGPELVTAELETAELEETAKRALECVMTEVPLCSV